MREYVVKYRKSGTFFWTLKKVVGTRVEKEADRLILFFADGGIQEVAKFSNYDVKLGIDWVLATKDRLEKEAGTNLKLSVQA
jgi:hypothetical protein